MAGPKRRKAAAGLIGSGVQRSRGRVVLCQRCASVLMRDEAFGDAIGKLGRLLGGRRLDRDAHDVTVLCRSRNHTGAQVFTRPFG